MNTITNTQKLSAVRSVLRQHNADSLTALSILVYLAENSDRTVYMKELALSADLTASGISLPVSNLEYVGLLKRSKDKHDLRFISVALTESGKSLANSLLEILNSN